MRQQQWEIVIFSVHNRTRSGRNFYQPLVQRVCLEVLHAHVCIDDLGMGSLHGTVVVWDNEGRLCVHTPCFRG